MVRTTRLVAFASLALGCTVGSDVDAGLDAALDAGPSRDAVARDAPLTPPDATCGRATLETARLPGSLLFVFDRSGSMDRATGPAGETRWELAGGAIEGVLGALPDEANVGMLLFPPEGAMCNVVGSDLPQVAIAPLTSSRAAIATELARVPDGPATPIFGALEVGWDHLTSLGARGERAVALVTDGRENCAEDDRDRVLARAAEERSTRGHRTFVIGLTQSNSDLSTLALNGDTRRNDTCVAECTTPACSIDSDVPCPETGAMCASFPDGEGGATRSPGFCGCVDDGDCPTPTTCGMEDGQRVCVGTPDCCHYDATRASFEADFRAALDAIVAEVFDTCVFDLPRGDDPASFDPNQVNVQVSLDGGPAETVGRSSDPTVDSWDYTDASQEAIRIQGELCDRIRDAEATVEIVLGCPTVLI